MGEDDASKRAAGAREIGTPETQLHSARIARPQRPRSLKETLRERAQCGFARRRRRCHMVADASSDVAHV